MFALKQLDHPGGQEVLQAKMQPSLFSKYVVITDVIAAYGNKLGS